MSGSFRAVIRGIPHIPTITEINIRSGAHTNYALLFKAPVGLADLPIIEAKPDEQGTNLNGKVYQWFRLQFSNGQTGWARDDLLEVIGDGRAFGYPVLSQRLFAFDLARVGGAATSMAAPAGSGAAAPAVPAAPAAPLPTPPPAPSAPIAPVGMPAAPSAPAAIPTIPTIPAAPSAPAAIPTIPTIPAAPSAPTLGTPSGQAMIRVKTQGAAHTRSGPGTSFPRTGITVPRHTRFPLLEVRQEMANERYRWFRFNHSGRDMWIREDLVQTEGDTSSFGLPTDLYPSPMVENYWWVRGYNMPPNMDSTLPQHDGWDQGAAVGEPMLTGPFGGMVVRLVVCKKCTPERPNGESQGIPTGDTRMFSDPDWGFGYGNYVIVRYTHEQLPASTRSALGARGLPGAAIFVMYAHLASMSVAEGQTLAPGQPIGACGNTGNSSGAHVHLEIRASTNPTFTGWANIRSGVMDPVILFRR